MVNIRYPDDPRRPGRPTRDGVLTLEFASLEEAARVLCGPGPHDGARSPCCGRPISQTQRGPRCQCCGKAVPA